MKDPLFLLDKISFQESQNIILENISFKIFQGERVAILGSSGAGKTTLLRLLLGLVAPTQGKLFIAGKLASQEGKILLPPFKRRLAVVFQNLALWPHLTVEKNLEFALDALQLSIDERQHRIEKILKRVELWSFKERYPDRLSGGEQQRVAIARALVIQPHAILLDEPLAHLDIVLKQELQSLFRELFDEWQTTVLYVSHDPFETRQLTQKLLLLDHSSLLFQGLWEDLPENSQHPFLIALKQY